VSWLNPIALVGLLAVAVPILVHLFGRRVAKRQRFPSLRLLQLAATTPVSRSQPSDIVLLLVRCAIVAAAVLGLAQPRWSSDGRQRREAMPARVVIVDTSLSMTRLTSDGRRALDAARELGRALVDSARVGMLVETVSPGRNAAGAASWLRLQSGRRELVVISDMQLGAISAGDFATVPEGVGITLTKVVTNTAPASATGDSAVAIRMDGLETDVTWRLRDAPDSSPAMTILGADSTRQTALAVVRQLVPGLTNAHRIALVFPDYRDASAIAGRLETLDQPWQGDFLLALRSDRQLRTSSSASAPRDCPLANAAPIHDDHGSLLGAVGTVKDTPRFELIVFSCVDANTTAGVTLLAAVTRAAGVRPGDIESDPVVVPDESLRKWERPATEVGPPGNEETSPDGRWFWLLALLLLAVEEWLRRRAPKRKTSTVSTEGRERVA